MVEAIYLVNYVSAQIELRERVETLQVVYCFDQIVGKIEDSEIAQMVNILDLSNLV